MKKQFLKIAGVKTEDEFYNKYPSEEDFFKAHPEALKQLAGGGEAFPQIATMDNFFTYGSPVPPTYYAHGGAFPMAQAENQFFSPFYGNVPNPYNKAMGGSADESYPQAMSFPYGDTGPSTHFMMQDGGYMPEEEPLPRMGVKGYLTDFIGAVKNTAAKNNNDNLALHGAVKNPEQYDFEQARYGGNLKTYQSKTTQGGIDNVSLNDKTGPIYDKNLPQLDYNSDKGTTNNYYYGPGPQGPQNPSSNQQLPAEYYNDIDYMYRGRMRPRSDFGIKGKGMFGNYRSTGWLKDEYGLEGLRNMGMTQMDETKGGLFKRPSKTYYFGQQGVPGQVDQQGMPTGQGAGQQDPGKGMGFLARMLYRKGNMVGQAPGATNVSNTGRKAPFQLESSFDPTGYNANRSEAANQLMQNIHRQQGRKMDELQSKDYNLKREGITGGLGKRDERKLARLEKRNRFFEDKILNVDDPSVSNFQRYSKPDIHVQNQSAGSLAPMNSNPSSAGPRNDVDFNTPDFQSAYPSGAAQTGWQKGSSYVPPQPSSNSSSPQNYQQMQNVMNAVSAGAIAPGTYTDPNVIAAQNAAANAAADDSGFPQELLRRQAGPTEFRKGGSYNAGDVVDMTPEEIQRFIEMGGQVEFLD